MEKCKSSERAVYTQITINDLGDYDLLLFSKCSVQNCAFFLNITLSMRLEIAFHSVYWHLQISSTVHQKGGNIKDIFTILIHIRL